jgi:hypothetical protein
MTEKNNKIRGTCDNGVYINNMYEFFEKESYDGKEFNEIVSNNNLILLKTNTNGFTDHRYIIKIIKERDINHIEIGEISNDSLVKVDRHSISLGKDVYFCSEEIKCIAKFLTITEFVRYLLDNKIKSRDDLFSDDVAYFKFIPHSYLDYEFCKYASKYNFEILEYIPEEFKSKEICKNVLSMYGKMIKYVPLEMKNYEMYLFAAKCVGFERGFSLGDIPDKFKTYEIVYENISNSYGFCLETEKKNIPYDFLTEELCKIIIINGNEKNIKYMPKEKLTKELCLEAVNNVIGEPFRYIPNEFVDYELCYKAVKKRGYNLQFVHSIC